MQLNIIIPMSNNDMNETYNETKRINQCVLEFLEIKQSHIETEAANRMRERLETQIGLLLFKGLMTIFYVLFLT